MRQFMLVMIIAGTVLPWLFFGSFFAQNGISLTGFVGALFANGAAGGAMTDLILSSAVFWAWSSRDAAQRQIRHWWVLVPCTLLVGLCLAIPLYLYMREGTEVATLREKAA